MKDFGEYFMNFIEENCTKKITLDTKKHSQDEMLSIVVGAYEQIYPQYKPIFNIKGKAGTKINEK